MPRPKWRARRSGRGSRKSARDLCRAKSSRSEVVDLVQRAGHFGDLVQIPAPQPKFLTAQGAVSLGVFSGPARSITAVTRGDEAPLVVPRRDSAGRIEPRPEVIDRAGVRRQA